MRKNEGKKTAEEEKSREASFHYPCGGCAAPLFCPWRVTSLSGCCPSGPHWRAASRHETQQTGELWLQPLERTALLETSESYRERVLVLLKEVQGSYKQEDVNIHQRDSLYTGYGGVFDEGEIVGYVLVIGQPAVNSHQAVLAQSYLDNPIDNTLYMRVSKIS